MVRGWVCSQCVVSSGSNERLDIAVSLLIGLTVTLEFPREYLHTIDLTTNRETGSERMARRLALLKLIINHPVNRSRRVQAIGRWAGWQAWRFIVRRPITVRVWPGVRARVYPDWPYSWTAIYLRLAEYDDMMFALRYLRPGDSFVDVGANVGFYSLLASS